MVNPQTWRRADSNSILLLAAAVKMTKGGFFMTRRVFTPKQDKEVVKLYLAGYATRKIAEMYGCEKSAVSNALEREGINRRTNRDLTDGEETQILRIYQAGYSPPGIARVYGKSDALIRDAVIRQGGKLRDDRFNFCEAEEREIIKIYLANKSIPAIARAYGCMGKAIRGVMTRNNITLRKTTRNFISKPKPPKVPRIVKTAITNHTAFDILDNEAALYHMGFIYADGSLNKNQLKVGLSLRDLEQLKRIASFLGSQKDIRIRDNSCHIEFTSKHMADRLVELGMVSRRSHFDRLRVNIPVGLEHHFIRGYIDGDGCISNREKVIILGQADILTWIKECLVKYANASDKVMPYQRKGILEISWGGGFQFARVVDYIYKDATIYLERKKEVADKIKRGRT